MMFNPCCCIPLKYGVQFLAGTLIMVNSIEITVISMCIMTVYFPYDSGLDPGADYAGWKLTNKTEIKTSSPEMAKRHALIFLITSFVMFFVCLLRLVINVILFSGAKIKDAHRCSLWMKCTGFLAFVDIGSFLLEMVTNNEYRLPKYSGAEWDYRKNYRLGAFILTLYMMSVVYAFILEIEEDHIAAADADVHRGGGGGHPQRPPAAIRPPPELVHEPNFLAGLLLKRPGQKGKGPLIPLRLPAVPMTLRQGQGRNSAAAGAQRPTTPV